MKKVAAMKLRFQQMYKNKKNTVKNTKIVKTTFLHFNSIAENTTQINKNYVSLHVSNKSNVDVACQTSILQIFGKVF